MTNPGYKATNFLFVVLVAWMVLLSAGPTLVALLEAAVPLAIVLGAVAVLLRLFHTRKW